VCLFSVSGPGRERDSFFRKRLDLSHWPAAVWCGPVISPGAAAAAANVRETNERITPTSLSLSLLGVHTWAKVVVFFFLVFGPVSHTPGKSSSSQLTRGFFFFLFSWIIWFFWKTWSFFFWWMLKMM
jgi:hypothetical protein